MAAPVTKERSKDHSRRKNSSSADKHAVAKRTANNARGRQTWVWDDESVVPKVGHWERRPA